MRRLILLILPLLLLARPGAAQGIPFPVEDRTALQAALQQQLQEGLTVQEVRRFGPDAAVRVEFAQRANSLEQWLVVAQQRRVIAVQDEANGQARRVQASLQSAHPRAMLDVGRQAFVRRVALPEGRQRFVFALPVVDGCRACAFVAIARLGLDFDAAGRFRGTRSLGTVPVSSGENWMNDPRL